MEPPPPLDSKTKFVVLDDNVIKGYILNVLGTDQIHDFCDVKRLDKVAKQVNFPRSGGGRQICMNVPDKDEYVDAQCLETFHVFLETIFKGGMVYKYLNGLSGGSRYKQTKQIPKNHAYRNFIRNLTKKRQKDVIDKSEVFTFTNEIKKRCKKFYKYKGNHKLGNLKNICTNNIVKIYKKFYKTNVDKNNVFTVFNDICKTYYEEQYDDDDDEEPISFDEESNRTGPKHTIPEPQEDVDVSTRLATIYNGSPDIGLPDDNQTGGDNNIISQNLKIFIQTMAFTFCNCNYRSKDQIESDKAVWESWATEDSQFDNWFYFEKTLLMFSRTNAIEDYSRKWVNQLIKEDIMSNIKSLTGIRDGDHKIVCNYKPKYSGQTIINNSANINSYWKEYILNTYPGFVDPQSTGTTYTEWGTYNCGFKSKGNKYYYFINLKNPQTVALNTIKVHFNGNFFENTAYYEDYGQDIKSWKKVTASVALAKAFNNVYSAKRVITVNNLTWNDLIEEVTVKETVKTTIANFYNFSLFKGIGDISQEMSALIVNAGRENGSGNNSLGTNNFQNKSRFYLANDILSANRYILTMNYGLNYLSKNFSSTSLLYNNINKESYGGFFNVFGCKDSNFYLVEQNRVVPPVAPSVVADEMIVVPNPPPHDEPVVLPVAPPPVAPPNDVEMIEAATGNRKRKADSKGGGNKKTKKKNLKRHLKKSKTRKR